MRPFHPTAWGCACARDMCACRSPAWSSTLALVLDYGLARLYGISSKLQEFEQQGLQKAPRRLGPAPLARCFASPSDRRALRSGRRPAPGWQPRACCQVRRACGSRRCPGPSHSAPALPSAAMASSSALPPSASTMTRGFTRATSSTSEDWREGSVLLAQAAAILRTIIAVACTRHEKARRDVLNERS